MRNGLFAHFGSTAFFLLLLLSGSGLPMAAVPGVAAGEDPFLWLEDIEGERALTWVAQHNDATTQRLAPQSDHGALYRDALAVLDSASRIPEVAQAGVWLYDLWQDRTHARGLFRRTTLADFRREASQWETVLDIDALAASEGKPWAFGGAIWLQPDNQRCLIRLSPGGGDAVEVREFDAVKLSFVADGFTLPSAKSRVAWRDANALFVATDFGPGSLTESGYARTVKLWERGTPLAAARTLYQGQATSVSVSARRLRTRTGDIDLVTEAVTFWNSKHFQILDGRLRELAVPATADIVDAFRSRFVIWLKDDWSINGASFRSGSVVAVDPAALRGEKGAIELIVGPTANEVVQAVRVPPDSVLVTMLDNVRGRLYRFAPGAAGWTQRTIPFADNGSVQVMSADSDTGETLVLRSESFLIPPTLFYLPMGGLDPQPLKAQAPAFDGARFEARQYWTASADGMKIPYFVVGPKDMKFDGANPVWMFSYGGFEIALKPSYSGSYEQLHGVYGKLWLERGGVFVLANIRGGGEFGPAWHQAALKENHFRAFEDFEAVARDLAVRKITSPTHLGIEGRSNGGLLVAATMLRHPELYGAVVCGNPLVDMRRYHRLLAGASWVAEYGNPDVPEQWAYLQEYSPYQKVQPGQKYPPIIFYTTTRDDRVHPGHARKMAAKMEAMGYPVEYYENTEGGHHGSVTNEQLATRLARTYAFLWAHLR